MNHQNKNILLIIGFLFLSFLAYRFSILKTFEVREQLTEIKNNISDKSAIGMGQPDLVTREIYLDSIIGRDKSETSLQNNLLEFLNKDSRELDFKIIAFKEPHHFTYEDKTEMNSLQFVLEGNYEGIENILYKLENDHPFGTLSHIKFEKKKDFRLNRVFLQCSVVLQNGK